MWSWILYVCVYVCRRRVQERDSISKGEREGRLTRLGEHMQGREGKKREKLSKGSEDVMRGVERM